MYTINQLNDTRFTFNGVEYFKNFLSKVAGNKVEIYNCYEREDVLVPLTHFSEFNVNGSVYTSALQLQAALLGVIYSRSNTGDGGSFGQNNIGRVIDFGNRPVPYDLFDLCDEWNTKKTITITQTDTPVLVKVTVIDTSVSPAKSIIYTFPFLPGKGTYGWGGTQVIVHHFYRNFAVNNLTPQDLQISPDVTIYPLEVPEGENYIDVANASTWDFGDSGTETDTGIIQYYFSFPEDGKLKFALFIGLPGTYGLDSTELTESMFIVTTDDTVSAEKTKLSEFENDVPFATRQEVFKQTKVEYPKDVTFRPFIIYRNNDSYAVTVSCEDLVKDKIAAMKPYYVNYQTGSNSNNGLSRDKAFKTIAVAYAAGARLIYLTGGLHKIDSWGTLNSSYANADDLFIIGIGPTPTILCSAPAATPAITLHSTTTYKATDVNIRMIADMKFKDKHGVPLRLNEYFTVAQVVSNLGSYYYDTATNTLYFNLPDGRVPDADVLLLTRLRNAEYRANAGYHFVKNIIFMGGGATTGAHGVISQTGVGSTLMHFAKNCMFVYGQALAYASSGGEGTRNLYNKLNWFEGCIAYNNARDGINYLSDPTNPMNFIEVDCLYFDNDWRKETNNVNGSSFHGPGNGIRVAVKAWGNSGPNIADVDGSIIFNVGVNAAESTASLTTDTSYNSDFAVESNVGMNPTKMFLYDCVSLNKVKSYSITGTQPSYIYVHPTCISFGVVQIITPTAQQVIYGEFLTGSAPTYIFPALSAFVKDEAIIKQSVFDAKVLDLETGFAIDNTYTGSSGWFSNLNTLYPGVRLGYTVYAINTGGSYACRKLSATQWVISPIEGVVTQS